MPTLCRQVWATQIWQALEPAAVRVGGCCMHQALGAEVCSTHLTRTRSWGWEVCGGGGEGQLWERQLQCARAVEHWASS